MIDMLKTLGEYLSDPRIRLISKDAIRAMDLSREDIWSKSLSKLREEHFGGGIANGFERLFAAAETGEWYYEIGTGDGENTNLVWLPSSEPGADEKPYILLVPGGGFVNVWNLTEGWPVAAQFNRLGYHVFILTYQVKGEHLLERNMGEFAAAIRFIQANKETFHVSGDAYIPCGFSAGGYLVCLWNTAEKGYKSFALPKPRAVFPIYPLTSWKICQEEGGFEPDSNKRLFGCSLREAVGQAFEIPEHAESFAPCALFLAAGDDLVPPDHSRILVKALEKHGIPCRLEIGPDGGHGFADGTGMCMAGWTERAVRWYESLD